MLCFSEPACQPGVESPAGKVESSEDDMDKMGRERREDLEERDAANEVCRKVYFCNVVGLSIEPVIALCQVVRLPKVPSPFE